MTLVILLSVAARGQHQKRMSIGELFERADAQNPDIRAAQSNIYVVEQQEEVVRSVRLPQINASLTLSYLGDGTILDRDFSHSQRDKLPHFSNTLDVELYQPLYTGGSLSGGIALSEKQTAMARIGLDATRNGVRMTVISNYLELAKNRNLLAVYDENIRLTEKLLEEMKVKREQGIVLKNDITRYELKLSSLGYDRLVTRNAIRICNVNLISLLGLSDTIEIVPELKEFRPESSAGEEAWLQAARTGAPSLKTLGMQSEMEQVGKRITRAGYLPKIGLIAGDNFLGPVTFEVPVLDKNYNAWFVGVNVKWNLSSLFTTGKSVRKHDLELTHIAMENTAAEESVERRIHEAFMLYRQAVERLGIERKNVQLAEENYSVVSNRFENQLALLTDMLDASNARLDAGVRLVNAEISAQFYYYQLHFISGTLIEL